MLKKKAIAGILVFVILFDFCFFGVKDILADTGAKGNDKKDPILIRSCRDLQNKIKDSSKTLTKFYKLNNPDKIIDCSMTNPDSPNFNAEIWGDKKGFKPINLNNKIDLNGNGHKIINLYINRPDEAVGLFSKFKGKMYKFSLEDVRIKAQDLGVFTSVNSGIISEVFSTGKVILKNNSNAGGIVEMNLGTIKNSYSKISIIIKDDNKDEFFNIGGLVGTNTGQGKIISSYSIVNIKKKLIQLVGLFESGQVLDSFYLANYNDNTYGTALSLASMKYSATFEKWDKKIWDLIDGEFPRLQWETKKIQIPAIESSFNSIKITPQFLKSTLFLISAAIGCPLFRTIVRGGVEERHKYLKNSLLGVGFLVSWVAIYSINEKEKKEDIKPKRREVKKQSENDIQNNNLNKFSKAIQELYQENPKADLMIDLLQKIYPSLKQVPEEELRKTILVVSHQEEFFDILKNILENKVEEKTLDKIDDLVSDYSYCPDLQKGLNNNSIYIKNNTIVISKDFILKERCSIYTHNILVQPGVVFTVNNSFKMNYNNYSMVVLGSLNLIN